MSEKKEKAAVLLWPEKINILLAVLGQGTSVIGHTLLTFALGLYVLGMTGSALSFSVTLVVSLLPDSLLSPIVGVIADRVPKKYLIIGSDALTGILLLAFYFYASATSITLMSIYAVLLVKSVLNSFLSTPLVSVGPRLVRTENLPVLASVRAAVENVIRISAPALGGLIYALVDIRAFLLFAGVMYCASTVQKLFINYEYNAETKGVAAPKESFWRSITFGARYMFGSKALIIMIAFCCALNLGASAMSALLQYTMLEKLALDEKAVGFVMAAFSVGSLLGAAYIARTRKTFSRRLSGRSTAVFGAAFVMYALCVLVPIGSAFTLATVLFTTQFLAGVFVSMMSLTLTVFLQTSVKPEYLGRFFGFFLMFSNTVTPLGALFFGYMADFVAVQFIFLGVAAGLLLLAVWIAAAKSIDRAVADGTLGAQAGTEPA